MGKDALGDEADGIKRGVDSVCCVSAGASGPAGGGEQCSGCAPSSGCRPIRAVAQSSPASPRAGHGRSHCKIKGKCSTVYCSTLPFELSNSVSRFC